MFHTDSTPPMPAWLEGEPVVCPQCGRRHALTAEFARDPAREFRTHEAGATFRCACGHVMLLDRQDVEDAQLDREARWTAATRPLGCGLAVVAAVAALAIAVGAVWAGYALVDRTGTPFAQVLADL